MENGIPPSALLFYWIFFPLTFSTAFSNGLRVIFLCAFIEVIEARANAGKEVAEGKVGEEEGEEVRVADMLIVRDKHFSAVVILGEAMTSLAC